MLLNLWKLITDIHGPHLTGPNTATADDESCGRSTTLLPCWARSICVINIHTHYLELEAVFISLEAKALVFTFVSKAVKPKQTCWFLVLSRNCLAADKFQWMRRSHRVEYIWALFAISDGIARMKCKLVHVPDGVGAYEGCTNEKSMIIILPMGLERTTSDWYWGDRGVKTLPLMSH